MDLELFRKVISDLQFPMDPTQTANLFEIFRNAQNKMNYAQMMTVLRGEMNEHRRGFVSKAFQRQRNRQGQVLLGALLRNYQSDNHPYVLSEVISQEEAKEEFEDNLQILLGNEVLSLFRASLGRRPQLPGLPRTVHRLLPLLQCHRGGRGRVRGHPNPHLGPDPTLGHDSRRPPTGIP